MKFLVLLSVVALAVAYEPKHDDFDVDALVANDTNLKAYNDCFIDAGPCDHIQAHFKMDIADAVTTACTKCTEAQKNIMYKYVTGLQKKFPDAFAQFKNKFDPEDRYFADLAAAVAPKNV